MSSDATILWEAVSFFAFLVTVGFILLWPVLIWLHLREHIRYLYEYEDIIKNSKYIGRTKRKFVHSTA